MFFWTFYVFGSGFRTLEVILVSGFYAQQNTDYGQKTRVLTKVLNLHILWLTQWFDMTYTLSKSGRSTFYFSLFFQTIIIQRVIHFNMVCCIAWQNTPHCISSDTKCMSLLLSLYTHFVSKWSGVLRKKEEKNEEEKKLKRKFTIKMRMGHSHWN